MRDRIPEDIDNPFIDALKHQQPACVLIYDSLNVSCFTVLKMGYNLEETATTLLGKFDESKSLGKPHRKVGFNVIKTEKTQHTMNVRSEWDRKRRPQFESKRTTFFP
ncbi:hypothetical protein QCA50_003887 [Cerrena zonata]|uniref:Uncharacterized protein n=1 Tax=Cerrena zonata TaxID=2478898 RepID=A0AAW0GQM0_9APHY